MSSEKVTRAFMMDGPLEGRFVPFNGVNLHFLLTLYDDDREVIYEIVGRDHGIAYCKSLEDEHWR